MHPAVVVHMAVHTVMHMTVPIAAPIAVPVIMHIAMQTKLEKPIIINGRPTYRSIPSRRSGYRAVRAQGAVRAQCLCSMPTPVPTPHPRQVRKIDYYIYSTAING